MYYVPVPGCSVSRILITFCRNVKETDLIDLEWLFLHLGFLFSLEFSNLSVSVLGNEIPIKHK